MRRTTKARPPRMRRFLYFFAAMTVLVLAGAFVSGVLMVLVGFSGGVDMGLYTIGVYFAVQTFDGYVVIPMIGRIDPT